MKKLLSMLLVLAMVFSMAACGQEEEAPAASEEKAQADVAEVAEEKDEVVIGLSLPTQSEERWVRDKERMEEVAADMGIKLLVQVANNDSGQQDSQAKNLLSQGVDALILAPHDAAAAASVVDAAAEEGVPVISYDRLITNTDKVAVYLSFDNVKVGELQGEYITGQMPKGKYIILAGAPTDNNAKLFKQGAMTKIQPLIDAGDIEVVMDQAVDEWKPENALKLVENALTQAGNEVDAILAPNDGTAGGAIEALAAQGLDGSVVITGQDASLAGAKRIVEGTQSMTIFKDTRILGEEAIKIAVELANGNEVEDINGEVDNGSMNVPSVLLTPYAVTKDNIDEILIDSGYLKKEDVY